MSVLHDILIQTRQRLQGEPDRPYDAAEHRSEYELMSRLSLLLQEHGQINRAELGDLSDLQLSAEIVDYWVDFFCAMAKEFEHWLPHLATHVSPPPHHTPATPPEQQMADDLAWARTAPEVQQHVGKIVAICDKRVLAVGTRHGRVRSEAARKAGCPPWQIVVVIVPDPNSNL